TSWMQPISLVILLLTWAKKRPAQDAIKMSLLNVDTALQILLEQAQSCPSLGIEELPLDAAENRVLAEPLLAQLAMPPWPNSSMDGYAVRSAEVHAGQALPVSQKIFAGHSPEP